MNNGIKTALDLSKMKASDILTLVETEIKECQDVYLFAKSMDKDPHPQWVRTNRYSNNAKYIPIRLVEQLLRTYFGTYQTEMIGQPVVIGNSVVVSVHLKVFHPILKEWLTYAGTGAVPIEVQKDAQPLEFEKINSKALHKNVPAAKSYAVSNAAKSIGKIFGSHLNSGDLLDVESIYHNVAQQDE